MIRGIPENKAMKLLISTFISLLYIGHGGGVQAALFGSDTWEECIIEGLADAKTGSSVGALDYACRVKPRVSECDDFSSRSSSTTSVECFLENVKNIYNDKADNALAAACRGLYGPWDSKPFKKPGFFDLKNLSECIFKYNKNLASGDAARGVVTMCQRKFRNQ
jgi:hypothetical protein